MNKTTITFIPSMSLTYENDLLESVGIGGELYKRETPLSAEIAKLRALVKDMWPFAKAGWVHTCLNRECCLFEECDADSERECPIEEHMAARMHELGIEVDE